MGWGKSWIANWVASAGEKRGDYVVRVSCKDLPTPTEDDILEIVGYRSYAALHASWRKMAEAARVKGRKLLIVIEEAQQLTPNGAKLWEVMVSLLYFQAECVELLVTGMPSLLAMNDWRMKKLMKGSILMPRPLNQQEVAEVVAEHERRLRYPLQRYLSAILRLSRGHFGTVKYLCQVIADNQFNGERLTETQVIKWARERGDMAYFAQIIWSGLSACQRFVIRKWLNVRGKLDKNDQVAASQLVDCGLWYRGGRMITWRVGWTLPFVREYIKELGITRERILSEEELSALGKLERRAVGQLLDHRSSVVEYDDLAQSVWSKDPILYSQWALSQLIARLRKKLVIIAPEIQIVTVRGVGWKLI